VAHGIYEKAANFLGEGDGFIRRLSTLPEPEALLYLLDCFAIVKMDGDGLEISPRRREWKEIAWEVTEACRPHRSEILHLVRHRERKACLHCAHWHPLDDSFGLCDLMPGICGRLYGCSRFKKKVADPVK